MKTKNYDRRIHRFLKILNDLSSKKPVVPKELAGEFNITVRTVQRDLSLLLLAGFPIDKNYKRYRGQVCSWLLVAVEAKAWGMGKALENRCAREWRT